MEFRYTKHQVARGSRPDIETCDELYLIKNVTVMHATYQVRLLTYRAYQEGKRLVLRVPGYCTPGPSLRSLMSEFPRLIGLEKE